MLYLQKRLPGTFLGQPLCGPLHSLPDPELLAAWHRQYHNPDTACICTTDCGALPPLSGNWEPCLLPQYTPAAVTLPNHIPWRRSYLILGFPCPLPWDNRLPGEALCQWLRPQLAALANSHSARLLAVQLHPDFVSELQIRLECQRGEEASLAEQVCAMLDRAVFPGDSRTLYTLTQTLWGGYRQLREDSFAWNRFAGRTSLVSGGDAVLFLAEDTFRREITAQSVTNVLTTLQQGPAPAVFACPVR